MCEFALRTRLYFNMCHRVVPRVGERFHVTVSADTQYQPQQKGLGYSETPQPALRAGHTI